MSSTPGSCPAARQVPASLPRAPAAAANFRPSSPLLRLSHSQARLLNAQSGVKRAASRLRPQEGLPRASEQGVRSTHRRQAASETRVECRALGAGAGVRVRADSCGHILQPTSAPS